MSAKDALKRKMLEMFGSAVSQAARVAEVEVVSEQFRLVTLEADAFRLWELSPADKVQLDTGEWNVRTYTPLVPRQDPYRMQLLAYMHGHGPGSRWAATVKKGDSTHTVRPKPVLDVDTGPLMLFGDETSFGTAVNLKDRANIKWLFEVDAAATAEVLSSLGVRDATVVVRKPDGAHLPALQEAALQHMATPERRALLTGHAQSIQQVLRGLKRAGVRGGRVQVKPYWATNKVGLD